MLRGPAAALVGPAAALVGPVAAVKLGPEHHQRQGRRDHGSILISTAAVGLVGRPGSITIIWSTTTTTTTTIIIIIIIFFFIMLTISGSSIISRTRLRRLA